MGFWDSVKKIGGDATKVVTAGTVDLEKGKYTLNPNEAGRNFVEGATLSGTRDVAGMKDKKSSKSPKGINSAQMTAAGNEGLRLGELLTGQTLAESGGQFQDLLKKQLALSSGASNPITDLLNQQRNAAVARTGAGLAKAGVRGGAAEAGKLQASRGMDKQIAAQAYDQYTNNLNRSAQMVAGAQRSGLQPKYTEQGLAIAANQPTFQGQAGGGVLSGLFEGLFG